MGDGPVHLIVATKQAEVLQPGRALTHRGFRVLRLERGATVELQHLPKRGWKTVDGIEGKLSTDPY